MSPHEHGAGSGWPTAADGAATVGAVARILGVTVRTLHHWDAIGLASPSERAPDGTRRYLASDVARLRRVLLHRDVGVPLTRIARMLDAPLAERRAELERRRDAIEERRAHLERSAAAVDRLLATSDAGTLLSDREQRELLGEGWQPGWVVEARDRWGDSPQWAEYAERAATMTPQDWRQAAERAHALDRALAEAFRAGVVPGSPAANDLAERHRALLDASFHCTVRMQVVIARDRAADPSVIAHHDALEPGLTAWLLSIVEAAAETQGVALDAVTWG